jgi:hypothetical protein
MLVTAYIHKFTNMLKIMVTTLNSGEKTDLRTRFYIYQFHERGFKNP